MIDKDMKIIDIVSEYPEKEEVFKPYDQIIGKCVMCHHLFETVEEFCSMYGLDETELLVNLNED